MKGIILIALAVVDVLQLALGFSASSSSSTSTPSNSNNSDENKFVIIGGSGRIGTAVASHLLLRSPKSQIILVGRDEEKGTRAVSEVLGEHPHLSNNNVVSFQKCDWRNDTELRSVMGGGSTCIIHTAGPFLDEKPWPLRAAIDMGCKVYVDVSDVSRKVSLLLLFHIDVHLTSLIAFLTASGFLRAFT